MHLGRAVLGIALCAGLCTAQTGNLSGTWKLNVEKSHWGKKQKPASVLIHIDHREPVLVYSGTVVDMQGDGRDFEFKGVLDGKEYAIQHSSYGAGKISFRRLDPYTTVSIFKSNDSLIEEQSKTVISRDGRSLTHYVSVKDPNGEVRWTEVYEK